MRIFLDARFYGTEHTGLGRYTKNVLDYLPRFLSRHELIVLLNQPYYRVLSLPANCQKVLAHAPHYSLREQFELPRLIRQYKPALFFAFHFNVPLFMRVPFIVTIHDIIKSRFSGSDTTTRNPLLFRLKRLGYRLTIARAVHHALRILVPTNTVKNEVLAEFNADPTMIKPILEAPDEIFRTKLTAKARHLSLPARYLLFVGNAYPHKNLRILLSALALLKSEELVIISKPSPFLDKTLAACPQEVLSRITILSNLTDLQLVEVYQRAKALIAPSLMEGYGLPGIEALMVGTPVIAADIPVFREVYQDKATYFNPSRAIELVTAVQHITSRRPLNYSRRWQDVAREISEVIIASSHSL